MPHPWLFRFFAKLTGLIFAVVFGFAVVPTLAATDKVALVIGNSAYKTVTPLRNPGNDAKAMKVMLAGLGFDVVDGVDLTKIEMEKLVRSFADKAKTAEISLVYYAGHAIQVDGKNYLIPVDAIVDDELALSFELIDLASITTLLSTGNDVGIVLLDACRDNPFTRSLARSMKSGRSVLVNKGLAMPSGQEGGLLIGYATAPGSIANDGDNGTNSPFTKALLKHLPTRGVEIEQVFKRVKADVVAETKNEQRPWLTSDLTQEVFLSPGPLEKNNAKVQETPNVKTMRTGIGWIRPRLKPPPSQKKDAVPAVAKTIEQEPPTASDIKTAVGSVEAADSFLDVEEAPTSVADTKTRLDADIRNASADAFVKIEPVLGATKASQPNTILKEIYDRIVGDKEFLSGEVVSQNDATDDTATGDDSRLPVPTTGNLKKQIYDRIVGDREVLGNNSEILAP